MRVLRINVQPTGTETHHRSTVLLDGRRWALRLYTNGVDFGWYLDVANDDASALVRGLAVVGGVDLLAPYRHLDLPPGPLWVAPAAARAITDPTVDDFAGARHQLLYLEGAA